MCEVVLWHRRLSAELLCAICFLKSFHFTISQATDSILWLKSVIFMCMLYLTEAASYQTSDTVCNTCERSIFKTSQNWDHNEKAKAIDGPVLHFLTKRKLKWYVFALYPFLLLSLSVTTDICGALQKKKILMTWQKMLGRVQALPCVPVNFYQTLHS